MTNAITKTNGNGTAGATDIMAYAGDMTREQVQLVKTAIITGGTRPVTDNELALFLTICNRRGQCGDGLQQYIAPPSAHRPHAHRPGHRVGAGPVLRGHRG